MKKTYLNPSVNMKDVETELPLANSIAAVGEDSVIQIGEGETPTTADSRRHYRAWEEEDLEEEEW